MYAFQPSTADENPPLDRLKPPPNGFELSICQNNDFPTYNSAQYILYCKSYICIMHLYNIMYIFLLSIKS